MTRMRLQVADLNAIETRVGAWLAGCHDLTEVFRPYTDEKGNFWRNGRDPYLAFASKMFGIPYAKLWADYQGWNGKEAKAGAKRMRQISKPGVLGAIYRLSGGQLVNVYDPDDPTVVLYNKKTGLWAYAEAMSVEMSQEQAGEVVRIFRESYPEICDSKVGIWKRLEDAVADVMHPDHPATVRYIGPNNAVKIDRVNIDGRRPMMRMRLPSGRYLHYLDAELMQIKMPWQSVDEDGEPIDVFKDSLVYAGTNQKTKQWQLGITTHGGKTFENLVQGIARDILGEKLLAFEAADMPVAGHVHDEGICLVIDDLLSKTVEEMVDMMSQEVNWAPGLLLGADGYQGPYYHK